ncbi:hypothetical protein EDD21DRAFT_373801 [Dissophora ornata]|nr:hypothetical protein EDD21DRAFT_373801 [Dissophora ornata]
MASLLEASLMMLERFFHNVEQTRLKLEQVMGPVRQTIQILEVSSIIEEWEQCEIAVQMILMDLERSLMKQQELQELELTMESGGSKINNNSVGKAYYWDRQHRRSISSAHSILSTSKTTTTPSSSDSVEQDSMPVLDNSHSQRVFVWRRFLANAFLEECVKSVEDLAQEKKELQIRIVELTRMAAGQDEKRPVDVQETKTSSTEEAKPPGENLSSKGSDAVGRHGEVSEKAAPSDEADNQVQATAPIDMNLAAQIVRAQRLKTILKQVVEWIDLRPQSKNNLSAAKKNLAPEITMDTEDEITSLGISDVSSMSAETNYIVLSPTASVEVDVKTEAKDLETLLQLIRDGLSDNSSSTTPAREVTEADVSTSLSPSPSLSAAEILQSGESSDLDIATNTSKARTRLENIITQQRDPIRPLSCTSTASSLITSSYLSSSSSSGRSFPHINIGGLSIPSSPGLSGLVCGPDGKPVLDVDALCRDLAFRSFPKQHQWSKSRRSIQTKTAPLSPLKVWNSTAGTGMSNTILPLPPTRSQ